MKKLVIRVYDPKTVPLQTPVLIVGEMLNNTGQCKLRAAELMIVDTETQDAELIGITYAGDYSARAL